MKLMDVLVKSIIFFVVLSTSYYLFFLQAKSKKIDLSKRYSNLIESRTAYVELTKLNPKEANFDWNKSNLVGILKETNKKGLEKPLSGKEKEIFERQNKILEKVFATKSYEEGVTILKSPESVKLLVDQTELIQDLAREREKLKALPLLR